MSAPPVLFGPVVLMAKVTVCGDEAPAAMVLKLLQPTPTIPAGRLQAKVTALTKVEPLVAVIVKPDWVDSPASAGPGVVSMFEKVKS